MAAHGNSAHRHLLLSKIQITLCSTNLTPPGIYSIHSMHIVFYTDHLQCYGCEEQQTSRKSNCTLECRPLFRRCKRFANDIQTGHRQTRLHIVARKCEKCVKNICQAPNQSKHFFLCILTVFWTKILYIFISFYKSEQLPFGSFAQSLA